MLGGVSRIEYDHDRTDSCYWNFRSPEGQDKVESRNFERDQQGFVKEKVIASHEAESIVDPMTGHSNEATADRICSGHFGHAVVNKAEHA